MLSYAWSWSPTSHSPAHARPTDRLDSNNQIAPQFPADKVSVPHSRRRVLQECRTILRLPWIIGLFVSKPISRGQDTAHPLSKGLPWPVSGAAVSPVDRNVTTAHDLP